MDPRPHTLGTGIELTKPLGTIRGWGNPKISGIFLDFILSPKISFVVNLKSEKQTMGLEFVSLDTNANFGSRFCFIA